MTCNGTGNRGCWFPAGMSSFNFRTQPTPAPAYTAISVRPLIPRLRITAALAQCNAGPHASTRVNLRSPVQQISTTSLRPIAHHHAVAPQMGD